MVERALQIGRYIYTSWTDIAVSKRIDALTASFSFSFVDEWSQENISWPFRPGLPVVASLQKKQVVKGYIDDMQISFDKESRSITLSGRDNTGDLVDCAAGINSKFEFLKQTIFQIATVLVQPFGIAVIDMAGDQTTFDRWTIDPGETVFENLERAARKVGVLFRSDGRGNLVIEKIGKYRADTPLIEGQNILGGSASYDVSKSFSEYIVQGQGNDRDGGGAASTEVEGRSRDASVSRFRPHVVVADGDLDQSKAQKRANWEATVRAGRSTTITVTTQGWEQESGRLWDVNLIVPLDSPRLGASGDMLIVGTDFISNDTDGTITILELSRSDAYIPQPEIPKSNDVITELSPEAV